MYPSPAARAQPVATATTSRPRSNRTTDPGGRTGVRGEQRDIGGAAAEIEDTHAMADPSAPQEPPGDRLEDASQEPQPPCFSPRISEAILRLGQVARAIDHGAPFWSSTLVATCGVATT